MAVTRTLVTSRKINWNFIGAYYTVLSNI